MGHKPIFMKACCIATATLALLTSCDGFDPSFPDRPVAPQASDQGGGAEAYPELRDIPRRPNLSYDLQQERDIQEGLVADRRNARYKGQQLRQEAGLRDVPPDPALPVPAPIREEAQKPAPPPDLSTVYVEEALQQDQDDGSLGDFLDSLERGQAPAVASPAPAAGPSAAAFLLEKEKAQTPAGPEEAAGTDYEELPVVLLSPPTEDGPLPEYLALEFANGSAVVDNAALQTLKTFATRLQRAGSGARVVASGDPPILALDRARAVAIRLVQHGVPGNWIDIETGGTGAQVVVYPESSGG